ncbi:hypothetical protein, partial [Mesorhizobium sp.]
MTIAGGFCIHHILVIPKKLMVLSRWDGKLRSGPARSERQKGECRERDGRRRSGWLRRRLLSSLQALGHVLGEKGRRDWMSSSTWAACKPSHNRPAWY